jgi:hypothetical protein
MALTEISIGPFRPPKQHPARQAPYHVKKCKPAPLEAIEHFKAELGKFRRAPVLDRMKALSKHCSNTSIQLTNNLYLKCYSSAFESRTFDPSYYSNFLGSKPVDSQEHFTLGIWKRSLSAKISDKPAMMLRFDPDRSEMEVLCIQKVDGLTGNSLKKLAAACEALFTPSLSYLCDRAHFSLDVVKAPGGSIEENKFLMRLVSVLSDPQALSWYEKSSYKIYTGCFKNAEGETQYQDIHVYYSAIDYLRNIPVGKIEDKVYGEQFSGPKSGFVKLSKKFGLEKDNPLQKLCQKVSTEHRLHSGEPAFNADFYFLFGDSLCPYEEPEASEDFRVFHLALDVIFRHDIMIKGGIASQIPTYTQWTGENVSAAVVSGTKFLEFSQKFPGAHTWGSTQIMP